GQFIIDYNGNVQQVQNAGGGTSGATQPTWNSSAGGPTADGTTVDGTAPTKPITWFNNGPGRWQPNTAYAKGQFIFDVNGCLQTAQANGTSGLSQYVWNMTAGGTTTDQGPDPSVAGITWVNDGAAAWQAGHTYSADQVVIDANGNLQVVQTPGVSGAAPPIWETDKDPGTSDNTVVWINEGPPTLWEPNTPYALHQCFLDPNGNIQEVQAAGTSGVSQFIWNPNSGETTQDAVGAASDHPLQWLNNGPGVWQPLKAYSKGQFILDSNGYTQTVQTAGKAGSTPPQWNANAGQNTTDSGVTWTNWGTGTWQPNATYSAGQFVFDSNGNIQTATMSAATAPTGVSGNTQPVWSATPGKPTTDGTILWVQSTWVSADVQSLRTRAGAAPFMAQYTDPGNTLQTIPLISDTDWTYLDGNGLQGFIDYLNAKVKNANDLLDLAFLTTQTDIYRFRQNVLTTTDASRLATSPVLANIATGDSASATALQVQNYYENINLSASKFVNLPSQAPQSSQPSAHAPAAPQAAQPAAAPLHPTSMLVRQTVAPPAKSSLGSMSTMGSSRVVSSLSPGLEASRFQGTGVAQSTGVLQGTGVTPGTGVVQGTGIQSTGVFQGETLAQGVTGFKTSPSFGEAQFVSTPRATNIAQFVLPPTQQITQQAPIVGAQLDVRTLTIAERLAQSPSQESMFYAVANRVAFMQALLALDITIDDLPFLVDAAAATWQANTAFTVGQSIVDPNGNTQFVTIAGTSGGGPPAWKTGLNDATTDGPNLVWTNVGSGPTPVPTEGHFVAELKATATSPAVFAKIQTPFVRSDIDEAGLFSIGIRVVEQHSQLMRALEARVQTYVDFISLCNNALSNVQTNVQAGQVLLKRLDNELAQARQDLAFTTALLGDEQQRVAGVNAQRQQVLQTSVQLIAYTRPRSLQTTKSVPSRQLVSGSIVSPVPTCLQQSTAVPPELREIVALLSDAPVSWLPSVAALVSKLDRPPVLIDLANDVQLRATMHLQLPLKVSSAVATPSAYGPAIAGVYAANQQVFRDFQLQRATYQPATLTAQSWSTRVATLTNLMGVGDLTSSESVHTEIANATARIVQEVASVAGCIYARANVALPVDRLAWAEFLTGTGLNVQLRSLAVLPNWNTQPYVDRQQMQLLVDWLFAQIDIVNPSAVAFMSDVVRVCILLASHAPVNDVIAGAVLLRNPPSIGSVVSLSLPSSRVAAGMYVQLYSKGSLAAEAVVSDLDDTSVTATVSSVHQPGVFLEANDVAHFTSQPPQAAAVRVFAG
ncbi:MAG TPA: hypothetical protein VN909_07070, partial [Candidatus Dormibacteraeota bacterium]|nr:hypothetical protein [Candidatus Dormibacteraeota bacterium]